MLEGFEIPLIAEVTQFTSHLAVKNVKCKLPLASLVFLDECSCVDLLVVRLFQALHHFFVKPRVEIDPIDVESQVESDVAGRCFEFKLFQVLASVVLPIREHSVGMERSCAVSLSENICCHLVHGFVEASVFRFVAGLLPILVGVDLLLLVDWLDLVVYVDQVNIEGDVKQFVELLVSLLFDVKLTELIVLVIQLVPGVTFETVEKIVVGWVEVVVLVELVRG
jgi:hypothetical protein